MGKIVKYCAACDESFAEKFGFCPNCGQVMTAFEMNPLNGEPKFTDEVERSVENKETVGAAEILAAPTAAPVFSESFKSTEMSDIAETQSFSTAGQTQTAFVNTTTEIFATDNFVPETKTFAAAAGANPKEYQTANVNQQLNNTVDDGGYRITVIEEKNIKQRNALLLGTLALMVTLALGGTVYSLFNRDLMIGAIGENDPLYVSAIEDVPMEVEEKPKEKNDKDAGGGGGGGKEEPEPPSRGRLVSQSENPITPPSVNIPQLRNPSLPVIMETQGNIKRPRTEERPGLPGSDNLNPSNGGGRGGGIGTGTGTGIGGGTGTGEGNGNGSGSGNGDGNGNGNGRGDGNQGLRATTPPPPPAPKPVGPTEAIKILSKPQPRYTDAARQNSVQGTVTLKVTFTANGQIGSIAPVNGLPYGLTEQAIAAARQIRFEPPKKNGVPYGVSKTVSYTFTIY